MFLFRNISTIWAMDCEKAGHVLYILERARKREIDHFLPDGRPSCLFIFFPALFMWLNFALGRS